MNTLTVICRIIKVASLEQPDPRIHCFNPSALRMAKTLWCFGYSECNRVNVIILAQPTKVYFKSLYLIQTIDSLCSF